MCITMADGHLVIITILWPILWQSQWQHYALMATLVHQSKPKSNSNLRIERSVNVYRLTTWRRWRIFSELVYMRVEAIVGFPGNVDAIGSCPRGCRGARWAWCRNFRTNFRTTWIRFHLDDVARWCCIYPNRLQIKTHDYTFDPLSQHVTTPNP